MSIDQVAIVTKIKKSFVEALERDDFSELPAAVYVNAYAKTLCRLYKVDEKKVFGLLNKVKGRGLEYTVPEEIIQHIEKGKQINLDQELKVRRLGITISIVCVVVILGILAGVQIFGMRKLQRKNQRCRFQSSLRSHISSFPMRLRKNSTPPRIFQ